MKRLSRRLVFVLSAVLMILIISSCSGSSAVDGTWYSDGKYSEDVLRLGKGEYSSTEWISAGKYTVDGDILVLTDLFGDTYELDITKLNGKTILSFEGSFAYHQTKEEADATRDARIAEEERIEAEKKAAEEAAAAAAAAAEMEKLKTDIIGFWRSTYQGFPVEFTADGKYIFYEDGLKKQCNYEIIDNKEMIITDENGASKTEPFSIDDEQTLRLDIDSFSSSRFRKATLLQATEKSISGKWNVSLAFPLEFDGEGTMTQLTGVSYLDKSYSYVISDGDILTATDENGEVYFKSTIFLIEDNDGQQSLGIAYTDSLGQWEVTYYDKQE